MNQRLDARTQASLSTLTDEAVVNQWRQHTSHEAEREVSSLREELCDSVSQWFSENQNSRFASWLHGDPEASALHSIREDLDSLGMI
jgi:gas vesicle protein